MIKQTSLSPMLCHCEDSLIKVIKIINDNCMGIAFVVEDDNKLVGTVTDGDIRRALLEDISLDEKVGKVVSKNCVFGSSKDSYDTLMDKMTRKIKVLPIVDGQHRVVDYIEFKQQVSFPVAIPNLSGNEFKYLNDAFLSSWISSSGEYISKFETQFAEFCGADYGVAVSNGTVALHLALVSLGIGPGDEVVVPDLTFAATINAVIHAGATPVIVDIESDSWCIDPQKIEEAISAKTKAIIPVHLFGQPCDMEAIMQLAKTHDLFVIEDCAQAHGAEFKGQKVGSFGDIGCFSFFGNKVITTGEGGMCITNSSDLDEKMRVRRDHGMSKTKRYWHDVIGYNYRLTNLQAAIGLAQLERIDDILENRRVYENSYKSAFKNKPVSFQADLPERKRITWLVSVLLDKSRDELSDYISRLKNAGLDVRPFFYPLSDMELYKEFCAKPCPVAKMVSQKGLNFPTYESLKNIDEIEAIIKELNSL